MEICEAPTTRGSKLGRVERRRDEEDKGGSRKEMGGMEGGGVGGMKESVKTPLCHETCLEMSITERSQTGPICTNRALGVYCKCASHHNHFYKINKC